MKEVVAPDQGTPMHPDGAPGATDVVMNTQAQDSSTPFTSVAGLGKPLQLLIVRGMAIRQPMLQIRIRYLETVNSPSE
jgi:hypothetical protein